MKTRWGPKKGNVMGHVKIKASNRKKIPKIDTVAIKGYLSKAYSLNQSRFSGITPNFKVVLCYSREDFNKEAEKKTERWEAAMADKKRIFIFAPSVFKKLTENNHSFYQTFTHEINHIFYMHFVGTFTPQWLMEGIAMLVDGTGKNLNWKGEPKLEYLAFSLKERWKIQSKSDSDALEFYRSGYLATKKLVNKLGMTGLASRLRIYSKRPVKANYQRLFDDR